MNCPSRTDELPEHDGYNQSPRSLAGDLTTRSDLNGIANLRSQRDQLPPDGMTQDEKASRVPIEPAEGEGTERGEVPIHDHGPGLFEKKAPSLHIVVSGGRSDLPMPWKKPPGLARRAKQILFKFSKFIGPGFMVSVAYIDPGNYSTDIAAGAATKFQLLFIVLLSNVFAVVLQTLALRLGTITGMDLAQNCRAHLPKWLNIALYIMAEAAIIATDIAEVGSASHGTKHLIVQLDGRHRFDYGFTNLGIGHRISHRFEFTDQDTIGGRVCAYDRGRSHHTFLVQSYRINATSSGV